MVKTTDLLPRWPNESLPQYRSRIRDARLQAKRLRMLARWSHKNEGTAETHDNAAKTRQGAIARLYQAGFIDVEQLEYACEIARVAELIESDVQVKCSSYEMRVDGSGSAKDVLVEGIWQVRRQVAYGWWRDRIGEPKRAILDMLLGEPIAYSAAAVRYRMGKKRARRLLIDAIDLWPEAMDFAEATVDREDLNAAHARLA